MVRTFLNNGQGRDENKSMQHREQPVELENKNMEVDWAPATPPRDSTRPSARARLQNMNKSEAHLVLTLKGGKQHKMKTKRKGMDCENMNKTFKWVTSTLSQENLDYISSQPSYVLMMGSNPGGDGNKDNKDNGNKKNGVYKFDKYALIKRLMIAHQLVTDNEKRKYRRMMNTIMNRGRWAVSTGNLEAEKQIWAIWARAKKWMNLTRALARLAREYEGKTRKQSPYEIMAYEACDLEGPPPDTASDAMETEWQQAEYESVSNGTQQDLETLFPELDEEEMTAMEAAIEQMGYKDDGIWSMGITSFDPTNRPWGHPPEDDESGSGAAGALV